MSTPEDVVRKYFSVLADSDLDGLVALFADDGVVMADDFQTATGSAEIRATFERTFANLRIEEQVEVDRVWTAGDLAVAQARSSGTVTRLESGTRIDVSYRELFVLRRSDDSWGISAYMFNSPAAAGA